MKQDQFSKWSSIKVKARANYTCLRCGSMENIHAHDPTKKHDDWHVGIALCGNCHSKEHPEVPIELFLSKDNQPYWPNISARTLAEEIGCHNRTIIRRAKKLNIPRGKNLLEKDKKRIIELARLTNKQKKLLFERKKKRFFLEILPLVKSLDHSGMIYL